MTGEPVIELRQVSKTFRSNALTVKALESVSFEIRRGSFVTMIGPSGSGKSTIFNLIVGLLEPDEGEILLAGDPQARRLGQVGYMPQRDLLLPWRTVLDNAILPLEIQGSEKQAARQEARPLLPRFGLQGFADAYPSALSGGMRQRAALLRTIMSQRELLLLDEPFGALDALTRFELQDWMLELWADLDKTILFITHDVEEALYLGDEVIVLSPRPGTIEQIMRVDLPRPRRRGMIAEPSFGRQATALLETLGARI